MSRCTDSRERCRIGNRSDSPQRTDGQPYSPGAAETHSGSPGWERWGWDRKRGAGPEKPKQFAGPCQQKPRGPQGQAQRTNQPGVRGSFRCPAAFWNLTPGKLGVSPPSYSASTLRGPRRAGQVPRGDQTALFPIRSSRLRPPAATYRDAGRNYLGGSGDAPLPGEDVHSGRPASAELPTQTEKQRRGATPTAPSRPCGSDARAGRVYPPVREEPLRRARASASLSVAGPLSEACAMEQEWARETCVRARTCVCWGRRSWVVGLGFVTVLGVLLCRSELPSPSP